MTRRDAEGPSFLVVDEAVAADADAVAAVQSETWLATYPHPGAGVTEADIRRRLDGDHGERVAARLGHWRHIIAARGEAGEVYVARLAGQVVGFTSPFVESGGRHRVGSLYVLPLVQGQGVGSRLMRKNLDWHGASPVYLAVVAYNVRSIEFYRRFGFRETGRQLPDLSAQEGGDRELPEIEMVRPAGD